MAKPPVNDPLESAKVTASGDRFRDAAPPDDEMPAAPAAEEPQQGGPRPRQRARIVEEPPAPPAKQPAAWKVARDVTVSWYGQMISLRAGDMISESSYGPGCYDRMIDAGVAFEKV